MTIEKTDLRKVLKMDDEGLVIDCVDEKDLGEILKFFVKEEIIKDTESFQKAYLFDECGRKRALLKFEDLRDQKDMCPIGRLAMFRLQTWNLLCGTWLSDFQDFKRDLDE